MPPTGTDVRARVKSALTPAALLDRPGPQAGRLPPLLQRVPLAPLPHRVREAAFRGGALAGVPGGERAVRGRDPGLAGTAARPRAAAGLPSRPLRLDPARPAPGPLDRHVLAHPMAQSGGLPHVPLAARAARGPSGLRPGRLPHPVSRDEL